MALVMFDRARWTGKGSEADIFRHWLLARLSEAELQEEDETAQEESKTNREQNKSENDGEEEQAGTKDE
jgi:hypothetical protein